MKTYAVALIGWAVMACSACTKNQDGSSAQPAPSAETTAAVTAPAAAAVPVDPRTDTVRAASTGTVPAEPNAPPAHDEHERAAAAEIHKGNYKSELDSLEKEDLAADRK